MPRQAWVDSALLESEAMGGTVGELAVQFGDESSVAVVSYCSNGFGDKMSRGTGLVLFLCLNFHCFFDRAIA